MKRIYNFLLIGFVALVGLTSCDKGIDPIFGDGEGQLRTKSIAIDVVNSEEVVSRSSVDVSTFTITIRKAASDEVVYSWKYSEMPEIITLDVGEYKVEAFNAAPQDAAFEAPYYYASKEFTIVKDEITEIGTLVCKLANVKVSIRYSDELAALIGNGDDVNVNVVVGELGSLDFAFSETRAGYFRYVESSTTLVATFSGTVDGFFLNEYKVYSDVAPGQHRIITFSLKSNPLNPDEYGSIGTSGLSIDATVTNVDLTIDVPVTEEPVDPDDMLSLSTASLRMGADGSTANVKVTATGDWTVESNQTWLTTSQASGAKGETTITVTATANETTAERNATLTFRMGNQTKTIAVTQAVKGDDTAPTITSTSIDVDGVNIVSAGMTAAVTINAPKGIAHLNVTIDSPSLTPADLEDVGLGANFDLAYPGELEGGLSGLGFPTGSNVIGKNELVFDISSFMGLLQAFAGEHHFILNVVDANGQEITKTLKFLVQ